MAGNTKPKTIQLTCEVCSEHYTDPLMLSCLHSFCKKCLIKVKEQGASGGSLKCPTCSISVPLPDGKIEGLSQNSWLARQVKVAALKDKMSSEKNISCDDCVDDSSAVSYCTECCVFLCTLCKKNHQRRRETVNHELTEVGKKSYNKLPHIPHKPMYCSHHTDEKLKFYCHKCQVLACRDCIIVDHRDHQCSDYVKVAGNSKKELRKCLTDCENVVVIDTVNDAIANGEKMLQQIEKREEEVIEEIKEVFSVLQSALESRCKVLISQSKGIANEKRKVVEDQLRAFEKLKSDVCYASQLTVAVVESDDSEEILSIDKLIKDQLTNCVKAFQENSFEIAENEKMFTYLDDVTSMSNDIKSTSFGCVSTFAIDPSGCSIDTGAAVPMATVGKERKFTTTVVDDSGRPINDASILNASLVSVDGGEEEKVTVVNANNCITVSCIPQRVGQLKLSLKVRGKQIKGSPYRLSVKQKRNYGSIQNQCTYNVGLATYGVTVGTNGEVYASSGNGYIKVFNNNGTPTRTINGNGQLGSPYGLALVGDTLYVTDYGLHRVQMFSASTGEHIGQFGSNGSGQGHFSNPYGITYNGKGHILVADFSNRRVQVFSMDGTFVQSINCDGQSPTDVAVDNDGNIHVTYSNNSIVQVFSSDGITKIRTYSNPNGNFQCPQGIAIDDEGYCFIITQYSSYSYLHVLDSTGQQVNVISGFNNPWGVALDREGYVYVADTNNSRIMKY